LSWAQYFFSPESIFLFVPSTEQEAEELKQKAEQKTAAE